MTNKKLIVIWLMVFHIAFSVNAVTINVDTTISASDLTIDNQDLSVDGAVLTIDGNHSFLNVELINGATLTHTQGNSGLSLNLADLSVDSISKIDVSGKGNPKTAELSGLAGASYAGYGVLQSVTNVTNSTYGDLRQPVDLGSGGATLFGGGAIKLNISGVLDLAGEILANGEDRSTSWGDGSGGSVWIITNSLTGSGLISADGGHSTNTSGGGGRVALYYNSLSGFDIQSQISAFGGLVLNSNTRQLAGAGTVYLKDNNQALGEIRIVNQITSHVTKGFTSLSLPLSGAIIEPITLINAKLEIETDVQSLSNIIVENSEVIQNSDLVIDEMSLLDSTWSQLGTLTVNTVYQINDSSIDHQAAFVIPEANPYVIASGMQVTLNTAHGSWTDIIISDSSSLTLNAALSNLTNIDQNGGVLTLNASQPLLESLSVDDAMLNINAQQPGLVDAILTINNSSVNFGVSHTFNTINILNNSKVTHSQGFLGFELSATNLVVDANSKIDVSGKGNPKTVELSGLAGASHAGYGVLQSVTNVTNSPYGDLRQPVDLGSGGATLFGGGAIKLNISGVLDLVGEILANGEDRSTSWGDGSGGSVWIITNNLTGQGLISADGGHSTNTSGGGGRVALYYNSLSGFDVQSQISAFGGLVLNNNTRQLAGAGTVYLKDNNQALGEIRIVNQTTSHITKEFTSLSLPSSGAIIEPITLINAKLEIETDVQLLSNIIVENSEVIQNSDLVIDEMSLLDSTWSQLGTLTVNTVYQINDSSIDHQAAFVIPEANPYVIASGMQVTLNTAHGSWTDIIISDSSSLTLNAALSNLTNIDQNGGVLTLNASQPLLENLLVDDATLNINAQQPGLVDAILTINNSSVNFGVSHTFNAINILNNSKVTHSQGFLGFELSVTNLVVDANSKIDVSGKGNPKTVELSGLSGGSHAGYGVLRREVDATNSTYGDLRQPVDLGSGGVTLLGGGAIKLNISGILDLDGEILANGEDRSTSWGDGSGGSVWIITNNLTGQGLISADGGHSTNTSGGGGRVALYYNSLSGFDVQSQISAFGGLVLNNNTRQLAGAGTVYLKDNNQALGEIRIVNQTTSHSTKGFTSLFLPLSGAIIEPVVLIDSKLKIDDTIDTLLKLTAINSEISQDFGLIMDELILNSNSFWMQNGVLTVNTTYQIDSSEIIHNAVFNIPETSSYIIANGAHEILNVEHPTWVDINVESSSSLTLNIIHPNIDVININGGLLELNVALELTGMTIVNGGIMTHRAGVSGVALDVNNLSIDSTSKIDVSGKGNPKTSELTGLSGGSHAGYGMLRRAVDATNSTYGDLRQPIDLGSGGSELFGGGAIKLNISGILDLDGEILANGEDRSTSWGDGSGGSVWIITNSLKGSGSISADGGHGTNTSGGGGRVALYYNSLSGFNTQSQISAFGGLVLNSNTQPLAGAGTIYLKDNNQALGEIRVVNQTTTHSSIEKSIVSSQGNLINNDLLVIQNSNVMIENTDSASNITVFNSFIEQNAELTTAQLSGKDFTWKQSFQLNLPNNELLINNWVYIPNYLQNWSKLELINNASIVHEISEDITDIAILETSTLSIDNTSFIDLTALGLLKLSGTSSTFGGSYGGLGGVKNGGVTNAIYGDELTPNNVGVGGSSNERGGGGIKITTNYLNMAGNITANATTSNSNGGRPSGGSVWLEVGALDGDGLIKTNGGGASSNSAAGGSGGRIAVYYGVNQGSNLALRTEAKGGVSNSGPAGGDGTIHLEQLNKAPRIVWVSPEASNQQMDRIRVHFDQDIDPLDFTTADVQLTGNAGSVVISSISTISNGVFDVILDAPITVADNYQLLITAVILDQNNNEIAGENPADYFSTTISIDFTAPIAPTVTNAEIAPSSNLVNINTTTVRGEREAGTALYINGELYVASGDSDWSLILELPAGNSTWELTSVDAAGNVSEIVRIIYFFAEDKPAIISMTPVADSCIATAPANIQLSLFDFSGNGFDDIASQFLVTDGNSQNINGTTSFANDLYTFTPDVQFSEGLIGVSATIVDVNGVSSDTFSAVFNIDQSSPASPNINPVISPTTNSVQTITGTKDIDSSVWINGIQVVSLNSSTNWSTDITLLEGTNNLTISSRDCADNESATVATSIVFNNSVPAPVNLTVNVDAGGRAAQLDWQSYDEAANGGNIDFYTVYQSAQDFTDVSIASVVTTIVAGTQVLDITNIAPAQTIYYAVVATDLTGLSDPMVIATSAEFIDTVPPLNPGSISITESLIDQISISWIHTNDTVGDLAHYRLYLDNVFITDIAKEQNTYQFTGLTIGTRYEVKVTAIDDQGVESSGRITPNAFTLFPNPLNLQAEPHDGRITLTWDGIPQSSLWHVYRIYISQVDSNTVLNMTVIQDVSGTTFDVIGLTNNTNYYFAVVTKNLNGFFDPIVTTIMKTPIEDTDGPIISNVQIAGINLQNGLTITNPGKITLTATDDSGMASTSFNSATNILNVVDGNGSSNYQAQWNIEDEADGNIDLTIVATDVFNNETTITYNVNIQLAAPGVPIITSPFNNTVTAELQTSVTGHTDIGATIELLVNGQVQSGISVDNLNQFQADISLQNDNNTLSARAVNNRGLAGDYSNVINIEVDQEVPIKPVALSAQPRSDGVIRLTWNPDSEGSTTGYNVYRSSVSFDDIALATQLNTQLVSLPSFDDLAIPDGQYFYRVVGVSQTAISGDASNQATAISDSMPPVASIVYTPRGEYDAINDVFGAGRVDIQVTLSEELLTTPYISMSPIGGVPIGVTINQVSTTEYTGFFELGNQKISNTAFAVFSAFDKSNNRGTDVTIGASIQVDTRGPEMTSLAIMPNAPLAYNIGDTIMVEFELNADPLSIPQLYYKLSKFGREKTEITGLNEISARKWQTTFILPDDVGIGEAETLIFSYSAIDELNNIADVIILENQFQIYQGNLPPLNAPFGLNAEGLPAGQIKLVWFNVNESADYEILRRHESEQNLVVVGRSGFNTLEYIDTPPADGNYIYAVASVRQENGQEAVSGPSNTVTKYSDSVPPNTPINMALALQGSGILATWNQSVPQFPGDEFLHYNLYRSNQDPIVDVSSLTAVFENLAQNGAIDNQPSITEHAYAATAIDRAGNESAPSNTFFLNFELLPVNNLTIDLHENQSPIISWSHTSNNITDYDIFVEDNGNSLKLNQSLVMTTQFIDTTYTGAETLYSVVAIDDQAHRSLSHSLRLPTIITTLSENQNIKRGLMNEVKFVVNNFENRAFNNISLSLTINGQEYNSSSYTLPIQGTIEIPVVIPGDTSLADQVSATVITHYRPTTGESANLHSSEFIDVEDGGLILSITTNNFLKGTNGQVQLMVQNPGEQSIDIITARNSAESDEIHFRLEDIDGNVLSDIDMKQILGTNVITIGNGSTIARIEPGASFLSTAQDIPIPINASSHLFVVATIDTVYHQLGNPLQRQLQGISTRQEITIAETSYTGELISIAPALIIGDDGQITIRGRAISRNDGSSLANVALKIILRVDGFEQSIDVFTDEAGEFTHVYQPSATDAGIYQVSVVHPDILDRPLEGTFQIAKLNLSPQIDSIRLPFNVARTQTIFVKAPRTLEYTNVTLGYDSSDQPGGSFLVGLQISNISQINNLKNQDGWQAISFDITANNSTPVNGEVVLRVLTNETVSLIPAQFTLQYELSTAEPLLQTDPQFFETGVNQGSHITESINLSNQGFSNALDLTIELLDFDSNPAPSWAALISERQISSLSVGEIVEVATTFNPPTLLADGNYLFKLKISAANANTKEVPIQVTVTHSGTGSIQFKTVDAYTATLDESHQPIPGVEGARIKLINEVVIGQEFNAFSDMNGDYIFEDIPVGRYTYRVTKENHNDLAGRINIRPATTEFEYAFLIQDFISIEWSVTETTITDRYEVVMNLTFETNVPAAVVVIKPVNINLPDMFPGDVFSGVLELKNEGLVRADVFKFFLPGNDEFFTYELLADVPDTIAAKQTIFLPYRIINHQSLVPGADGNAGGGGCNSYSNQISGEYTYECAEGTLVGAASPAFVSYSAGSSCPVGGGEPNPQQNGCNGRPNCGGLDFACNGRPNCFGGGLNENDVQCAPECEDSENCCSSSGGGGPGGGGGGGGNPPPTVGGS